MQDNFKTLVARTIEDPHWMAFELAHTGNVALNVISAIEDQKGPSEALRFAKELLKFVNYEK